MLSVTFFYPCHKSIISGRQFYIYILDSILDLNVKILSMLLKDIVVKVVLSFHSVTELCTSDTLSMTFSVE